MGYERNDRRFGRDQSYGYRPEGRGREQERGYARGEDRSYNRDRGYGGADYRAGRVDYGPRERTPADYDYDDRGFFDRAGDEVRSWFGDEEAERRRRLDERYAQDEYERSRGSGYGRGTAHDVGAASAYGWSSPDYGAGRGAGATGNWGLGAGHDRSDWGHDPSYRSWRERQIADLDRDYADYRREHQNRFDSEFAGWRRNRLTQRESLGRVQEHQEVVGSDGKHVGTVDHIRGDRILLTKTDTDAHGHHHSIPCAWISTVDDKVTINRTSEQAQQAWKDEERAALFGRDGRQSGDDGRGPHILNRSFSGTY